MKAKSSTIASRAPMARPNSTTKKGVPVERGSTLFLRGVVYVIGLLVLGVCALALPAGIVSDETDLYRPILLSLYIPAVPFFVALFQTLKLLGYVDENKAFSDLSVAALKNIRNCAVAIAGLFTVGMPYIYYAAENDDAPGVILVGLVIIFASVLVAVIAAVLQRLLQSAIEIKKENDLTV